jgi:hypothetical protein
LKANALGLVGAVFIAVALLVAELSANSELHSSWIGRARQSGTTRTLPRRSNAVDHFVERRAQVSWAPPAASGASSAFTSDCERALWRSTRPLAGSIIAAPRVLRRPGCARAC